MRRAVLIEVGGGRAPPGGIHVQVDAVLVEIEALLLGSCWSWPLRRLPARRRDQLRLALLPAAVVLVLSSTVAAAAATNGPDGVMLDVLVPDPLPALALATGAEV